MGHHPMNHYEVSSFKSLVNSINVLLHVKPENAKIPTIFGHAHMQYFKSTLADLGNNTALYCSLF